MMHWHITYESVETPSGWIVCRKGKKVPVMPYPGLTIGSLKVNEVFVHQAGDESGIEVHYIPVGDSHGEILLKQGWQHL